MRARNGVVPPGMAGFLVIAAAVIPALIDNAKPLARKLAAGLIRAGEKLREAATDGTGPQPEKPNSTMSDQETTKRGKQAGGVGVTTASPTGQEELEAAGATETKGSDSTDTPPRGRRSREDTQPPRDQNRNPKSMAVKPKKPATAPKASRAKPE